MSVIENIIDVPAEYSSEIFGQLDCNIKKIERTLHVTILARNAELKIIGGEISVLRAKKVLQTLIEKAKAKEEINEQLVNYALSLAFDDKVETLSELEESVICRTVNGKPVRPKTHGQKKYIDSIREHMLTFGIGPAGTGKTYLAMAMAITAFKNGDVGRIILTRPAIEAGENLGFLPGDLQSKVDPYLRPLYDALHQIMGTEAYLHNSERGLIEVAPLAYMRGRTLDNAFIILDEAQNTTPAQMKMFLTRIGFGSKVVVTGDLTQKDLRDTMVSGLEIAIKVLSSVEDISFITLTNEDVVRHPLVQKIVKAYEVYENRQSKTRNVTIDQHNRSRKDMDSQTNHRR